MNRWLFVVTARKEKGHSVSAREIFETRMRDKFWGLGKRTPNRESLAAGDRVVFYVGIPEAAFAGSATLSAASFRLRDDESRHFSHNREVFSTDFGVRLSDVDVWRNPIPAKEVVASLSFVENTQFWGSYFQGGIRGFSDADFETLCGERRHQSVSVVGGKTDIESISEFALESHLEEFLHANWASIQWGRPLRLYQTPESSGRQYPAGKWSIDFLAVDEDADALVVIELKRGQTSDATVGQVLRYVQWVRENMATPGQKVEGLIICREVDEALTLQRSFGDRQRIR